MSPFRSHHTADHYRIRLLVCVTASLALCVAAVRYWPVAEGGAERPVYQVAERETIDVEEVQPTRQAASAPAPPTPPIPVLVPDSEVLREEQLDFSDGLLAVEEPGRDLVASDGTDRTTTEPRGGITVGPKTVRFVEPEYTKEARRKRVRAELVVRVLVDAQGRVEQSTVVERFLLEDDGATKRPVDLLGYGLEEAALAAADRWMFRPARKDGKPVASHTVLTFTFGVDT